MSSSLTSGVPLGMPRSAASRPPSRPLSDLTPLGGSPPWEGHHGLDPSIWLGPLLRTPRMTQRVEVGPGLCPTPVGTTPPQFPPWWCPDPPCHVPHLPQLGQAQGVGGRDQPDWAATPAPNTFRISCQTGLSSPWGLFGVVTSLVSCCRECRRGASPLSKCNNAPPPRAPPREEPPHRGVCYLRIGNTSLL